MQTLENRAAQNRQSLDVISVKRNPYLVDYEMRKRPGKAVSESYGRSGRAAGGRNRGVSGAVNGRSRRSSEVMNERSRKVSGGVYERSRRVSGGVYERGQRPSGTGNRRYQRPLEIIDIRGGRPMAGTAVQWRPRTVPAGRRRNSAEAKKRRRRQLRRRKMMAAAWGLCIFMIGWLILVKTGNVSAVEQEDNGQEVPAAEEEALDTSSVVIQGLSAEDFEKHPAWMENFLPLNEYSRPGEALPEVKDIFVHYTANPETSAAQNRSYFAQQKDMHQASVSAHFIIGYDGEIIQCVPLDEIAYAVQTRNYDSVSIECCYKAADGSFTQETYDSLISLLAWLTDAYDLDTSHILRHYDCGGKKCPLYYAEHEDAWGRLKEDVAAEKEK